jgi:hypothetical protein
LTGISAIGLIGIVGSGGGGGGGGDANCSFFSNVCDPVVGPSPPVPYAWISPKNVAVQAGTSVTFTVHTENIAGPSYQWCRVSPGGGSCVAIAGATGTTYTLAAATLADDGAFFWVNVSGAGGTSLWAWSQLAVSSIPGVVFQDGDFLPANWTVSAIAAPALNGPVNSEEQMTNGGNPDAYLKMTQAMTQGPSSLRVFHTNQLATYDPAAQGAIYVIDYADDCIALSVGTSNIAGNTTLMIEQAGRRYTANVSTRYCRSSAWVSAITTSALGAVDFALADGPACGVGESCPDFSATGKPLRFGFSSNVDLTALWPATTVVHGIDNWKITVWRR